MGRIAKMRTEKKDSAKRYTRGSDEEKGKKEEEEKEQERKRGSGDRKVVRQNGDGPGW